MTPLQKLARTCISELETYLESNLSGNDAAENASGSNASFSEIKKAAADYQMIRELPFGDPRRQEFWRSLSSKIPSENPLSVISDFVDVIEREVGTEEFHITLFHCLSSMSVIKRPDLCVRFVDAMDEVKLKAEFAASGRYNFDDYLLLKAVCLGTPERGQEATKILHPLFEKFCIEENRILITAGWSLAHIYLILGNRSQAEKVLKAVLAFCVHADANSDSPRFSNIIEETERRLKALS